MRLGLCAWSSWDPEWLRCFVHPIHIKIWAWLIYSLSSTLGHGPRSNQTLVDFYTSSKPQSFHSLPGSWLPALLLLFSSATRAHNYKPNREKTNKRWNVIMEAALYIFILYLPWELGRFVWGCERSNFLQAMHKEIIWDSRYYRSFSSVFYWIYIWCNVEYGSWWCVVKTVRWLRSCLYW